MKKRIISIMLSLCMVLLVIPAQKVEAADEQPAMYLFTDILSVSCYHAYKANYPYRKPFDIVSYTASKANAYAPFDCKVVKISASEGNMVAITSLNPVRFANGTVDYMTIMLAHDNDISDVYVGKTYKQGEVFYQQGNAGYATGNHIHVELARGQFTGGNIWQFVRSKDRVISINDALYLYDNTRVVRDGGYAWKKLSGAVVGSNTNNTSVVTTNVTTGAADTITNTSAIVRGAFSVSGGRATECGMYLGTSENNLTFLGSDKVNTSGTSMYYSTSKYGRTLQPGTTYYYKAYAIANGNTTWGSVKSFTTTGSAEPVETEINKIQFSNFSARDISSTNAMVSAKVSYTGTRPSEVGVYFGNSANSMSKVGSDAINHSKNPFDMWYDLNKYGITLSPETVYYYKFYAVTASGTVWSAVNSFATTGVPVSFTTNSQQGTGNVSDSQWQSKLAAAQQAYPAGGTFNTYYEGGSAKAWTCMGYAAQMAWNMFGSTWYTSGAGWTKSYSLEPLYAGDVLRINGDKHTIFVTKVDGNTVYYTDSNHGSDHKIYWNLSYTKSQLASLFSYKWHLNSNTSTGSTSSTTSTQTSSNTYTAVVANTNGQYLAINDRAAASPNYSTQIGRIPPGGAVTVYPDRSSGNWYYVSYNNVSGYAYSKYLTTSTTSTTSTQPSNTRSAVVTNTNGQYLAINDRAAASPNYSTQIGRIPPGGVVTVHTDKTSGNWYYVTYNGVSGYAYNKFLTLQ